VIEVLISDEKSPSYEHNHEYFSSIDQWAQEFCPGYHGYHIQDVSDHSYIYDEIAAYHFTNEVGAMWFRLKWQK
jgi:hypothetical protein